MKVMSLESATAQIKTVIDRSKNYIRKASDTEQISNRGKKLASYIEIILEKSLH